MQFSPTFPGKGENNQWGFGYNYGGFGHVFPFVLGCEQRERRIVGISNELFGSSGADGHQNLNLKPRLNLKPCKP